MCTASWLQEDGGFQLLFNRDEKRTRLSAQPPGIDLRNRVQAISPVDGDHGGTWISVNERGVSLCLLNGAHGAPGRRSRGLLLRDLTDSRTANEALERLAATELAPYSAFTIAVLEPDRDAAVADWSGASLQVRLDATACLPLSSSSVDAEGVRIQRRREFVRIRSDGYHDAASLYRFHESHGARADAYSPCMHRTDAETVSFSWVRVTPREVSFFYTPAAPCRWIPGQTVSLARAA